MTGAHLGDRSAGGAVLACFWLVLACFWPIFAHSGVWGLIWTCAIGLCSPHWAIVVPVDDAAAARPPPPAKAAGATHGHGDGRHHPRAAAHFFFITSANAHET